MTWVSGSIASQPGKWRGVVAAIASRSGLLPQVMAYWLMSASTAAATAAFSSGGQAKSGKPCARLTAPAATARRFISRMTDSVNRSALAEIDRRVMAGSLDALRDARSDQPTLDDLVPGPPEERLAVDVDLEIHGQIERAASLVWTDRARISVWKSCSCQR